jgi:hypothetical protein
MTLEHVMALARQFGPRERLHVWLNCGTHELDELPEADDDELLEAAMGGDGGPFRYCEKCFCVWDQSGRLLNQPEQ